MLLTVNFDDAFTAVVERLRRMPHRPRNHYTDAQKLRLLITIKLREDAGLPAPDADWFGKPQLNMVRELVAEGALTNGNAGVRLTGKGHGLIAVSARFNKRKRKKPHIRADKDSND